jgi:hypothetical protein
MNDVLWQYDMTRQLSSLSAEDKKMFRQYVDSLTEKARKDQAQKGQANA